MTIEKNITTVKGDDNVFYQSVIIEQGHYSIFNHYFNLETAVETTTSSQTLADSKTINVVDATGFVIGDKVDIHEAGVHVHTYREIVNIAGTTITLNAAIDKDLPIGSLIEQTNFNMAVDGSATRKIYTMKPGLNEVVNITRLLIQIVDGKAADDSKFAGEATLVNGVHIRKNINNTKYETVAIWKSNKDLKEDMYDVVYSNKAGGGNFGVSGRWTITKAGAVINLDATKNEWLECIIQDNLSILVDFQIKAQGYFKIKN